MWCIGHVDNGCSINLIIKRGFEDIFRLLHIFWMDISLVHLISLSMADDIIVERRGRVTIMDPFYMDEVFLSAPGNRVIVSKYI
jgi:hypothetical protein